MVDPVNLNLQLVVPTSHCTFRLYVDFSEAVVRSCSVKKVFLEIWQNSQGNTCARVSSLKKVAGLKPKKIYSGTGVFLSIFQNF